jgi:N1221-like protein
VEGVFGEVVNAEHQMHWIVENVKLLRQSGVFEHVYTLLRAACKWMEDNEEYRHELVMFGD